jgi:hypothetical protein
VDGFPVHELAAAAVRESRLMAVSERFPQIFGEYFILRLVRFSSSDGH